MGTSASVKFKHEGNYPVLVNIYFNYDGYVEGVGYDLARYLLSKRIVNGMTCFDNKNEIANGFGCLIAQYIRDMKKEPGYVYIFPQSVSTDYVYLVEYDENNQITITITHLGKLLFRGDPETLLNFKEHEEEKEEDLITDEDYKKTMDSNEFIMLINKELAQLRKKIPNDMEYSKESHRLILKRIGTPDRNFVTYSNNSCCCKDCANCLKTLSTNSGLSTTANKIKYICTRDNKDTYELNSCEFFVPIKED